MATGSPPRSRAGEPMRCPSCGTRLVELDRILDRERRAAAGVRELAEASGIRRHRLQQGGPPRTEVNRSATSRLVYAGRTSKP